MTPNRRFPPTLSVRMPPSSTKRRYLTGRKWHGAGEERGGGRFFWHKGSHDCSRERVDALAGEGGREQDARRGNQARCKVALRENVEDGTGFSLPRPR